MMAKLGPRRTLGEAQNSRLHMARVKDASSRTARRHCDWRCLANPTRSLTLSFAEAVQLECCFVGHGVTRSAACSSDGGALYLYYVCYRLVHWRQAKRAAEQESGGGGGGGAA